MSTQARKANENLDLTGKTAVLAGASQGIGAGAAVRFAKAGANVIIIGRSRERLENVISQARSAAKSPNQKFDFFRQI
jgi:short-subunit dehydrogenase